MSKQQSYDAFISYRHADAILAKTLHVFLEALRITDQQTGKRRRLSVFRDKDELPVSNSLSADIYSALERSEYLIIVVGTSFQQSKYCMEELRYFLSLHGNDNSHVIPLLIEGEPSEVFPDVLRHSVVQRMDDAGMMVSTIEEVEPLAADARGPNILSQIIQLCRTEALRVAAPILGVPFADLYRRHRRRAITAASLALVLVVAGILAFGTYNANKEAEISRAEALRILDISGYPAEDDPTLAMMLAEEGCDRTPKQDGVYYARALATFRERSLAAGFNNMRTPFKAVYTLELPTSTIRPLHCYDLGRYLSMEDGENTYLYDAATGRRVFGCEGTEVWFDPSLSYAFSYRIANRKKTMVGYRIDTGETIYEYETDVLKNAPMSMEVWFDEDGEAAYIIEPDQASAKKYATDPDKDIVVAKVEWNEEEVTTVTNPKVPERVRNAINEAKASIGGLAHSEFVETVLQAVDPPYTDLDATLYKDPASNAAIIVDSNRFSLATQNEDYLGEQASDQTIFSYFDDDGKHALTITGDLDGWEMGADSAMRITLSDLDSPDGKPQLDEDLYNPGRQLCLCATDHAIDHIAYMDTKGTIHVYDTRQDAEIATYNEGKPEQVNTLAIEDDGKYVVVGRFVRTTRTEDWEYLLELYEVTSSKGLKLAKTIDITDYIDHRHGSVISHIEMTNDYVFVSGEESAVVLRREPLFARDRINDECIAFWSGLGYGGCSSPIPQFLTPDGLLFCTKGGVYLSKQREPDLFGIYDLAYGQDVPFGNGTHAEAYAYDSDSGYLAVQLFNQNGTGTILIYHLNEDRAFDVLQELLSSEHDLTLPSWKSTCDGTNLLVENDRVTQVFNLATLERAVSLECGGLSLSNGRLYDVTRTTISNKGSLPVDMEYEDLKQLSERIRKIDNDHVRTFSDSERSKYNL